MKKLYTLEGKRKLSMSLVRRCRCFRIGHRVEGIFVSTLLYKGFEESLSVFEEYLGAIEFGLCNARWSAKRFEELEINLRFYRCPIPSSFRQSATSNWCPVSYVRFYPHP